MTGAALLPASLLTGVLWQRFGAPVALGDGRRARGPRGARPAGARARAAATGAQLTRARSSDEALPRSPTLKARHRCPPRLPRPTGSVDFGRSFTFVTEDPDWIKKILIGGVFTLACALLVGVPFVLGYFSRTLRNVVAGEARPMPEWDDLGGIFNEGLRLTAVYLVYALGVRRRPGRARLRGAAAGHGPVRRRRPRRRTRSASWGASASSPSTAS